MKGNKKSEHYRLTFLLYTSILDAVNIVFVVLLLGLKVTLCCFHTLVNSHLLFINILYFELYHRAYGDMVRNKVKEFSYNFIDIAETNILYLSEEFSTKESRAVYHILWREPSERVFF